LTRKNIIVLEPYFGGSHRSFLSGLQKYLPFSFHLCTLPARKWKWRMRFSASYFAGLLPRVRSCDAVLCSTFVDVACLRGLGPAWLREVPILTYFHENQFAYPVQAAHERDMHFAVTNMTTALSSEKIAFNSFYNMESFFAGCVAIQQKIPDMKLNMVDAIRNKSSIIYPGIDFAGIDEIKSPIEAPDEPPIIIWNHRWEYDKNPELFFQTLFRLDERGINFRLVILGQSFNHHPDIFQKAFNRLSHKIIHIGYLTDKTEYYKWLRRGTVVVSTAEHEFYGMAIIEAVRAGCRPLLPARLSYPELFPQDFLYNDDDLEYRLGEELKYKRLNESYALSLTDRFGWNNLAESYIAWFNL